MRAMYYLMTVRLLAVIVLTALLEQTKIITGPPGIGRYAASFLVALLLIAVFAEKHLVKLAKKLAS